MTAKRSDRLRSMIAATVADAAENAAPVTITGAGMQEATVPQESSVKTVNEGLPSERDDASGKPGISSSESTVPSSPRPSAASQIPATSSPTDLQLRAPERPAKLPKWEKANVTLEPRDLAILQRSDAQARAYGFRIRKGGNPSLFVRAGLRLLDELADRDPEAWIKRIAATTLLGTDAIE